MSKKVIIIGGGLGGIATASYLAKAGYDVQVHEKLDYIGGRVGAIESNGFYFDIGPSWYLMPEVFEHYFELMGTTAAKELDLVQLDPFYKVFFESGSPVTIGPDQAKNQATFEAIEPGAGEQLVRYAKQSARVYDLSIKHFLYTNFQTLGEFIKPEIIINGIKMGRLALTSYDHEVSRFFTNPKLKQILEYSSVFLGASPYDAPAIYTLMATLDYRDGVFYPRGGMATVAKRMQSLAEQAGVKFYPNSPVKKITADDGRATGVMLESGDHVDADIVISNADLHFTETRLLDKQWQTYPEKYWKKRNPGPSSLMIYLGVKGELSELEHHDLLFVDTWRENFDAIYRDRTIPNPASIYISRTTATDPSFAPAGHEALVVLVPVPAGDGLEPAAYEAIADEYIEQIARMTGVNNLKDRIVSRAMMTPDEFGTRYNAWENNSIGPAHTLKQTAIFRTNNRSRKLNNLYYVGGMTLPGIGMPMVLISAEILYKRIVGDRRGGRIERISGRFD